MLTPGVAWDPILCRVSQHNLSYASMEGALHIPAPLCWAGGLAQGVLTSQTL